MSNIESVTFGVEIETTVPRSAGITIGGYHNGLAVLTGATPIGVVLTAPQFQGASWTAERDGSINSDDDSRPCEFVSPILQGEAGIEHLLAFVAFLHAIGAKVNASCGLHIHVGVQGFAGMGEESRAQFIKSLSRLVSQHSTGLYAQTGTLSRERGHFCAPINGDSRKRISSACRKAKLNEAMVNRYHILNLCNLPNLGTVEFRCFAGTLNSHKILLHLLSVLLLCKVAQGRKSTAAWDPPKRDISGLKAVKNILKLIVSGHAVTPFYEVVQADIFRRDAQNIREVAERMASKYDEAKAVLPATNTRHPATPANA